jgi:hypothetical protein
VPLFLTVTYQVMAVPAVAVEGPVLAVDKSADAPTVVVAVAVLLPGVGSGVVLVAVATLFSIVPLATEANTVALMVSVWLLPAASVPTAQVGPDQLPCVAVAVTPVSPDGNASLTDTFCASEVPLFLTVT